MAHPQIAVFARLANGQTPPTRLIAGQATKLSRTMHDIHYDEIHDEFVTSNPFAQAIMTFPGGAVGEASPIRIIQGSKTRLANPDRLDVDALNNEIFVPNRGSLLVFDREDIGNVAPKRIIEGPDTELTGIRAVAVDPSTDLLVVGTDIRRRTDLRSGLLVFERTANGNSKPIRIIRGPSTGITRITQMQIHNGWIVASQPGRADVQEPEGAFVGVWSLYDDGDVKPKYILGGPKSRLKKPRGVDLDIANKEMIVADMRANAVFTYYFPEIFDARPENDAGPR